MRSFIERRETGKEGAGKGDRPFGNRSGRRERDRGRDRGRWSGRRTNEQWKDRVAVGRACLLDLLSLLMYRARVFTACHSHRSDTGRCTLLGPQGQAQVRLNANALHQGSHSVAQANLEVIILLPQYPYHRSLRICHHARPSAPSSNSSPRLCCPWEHREF